MCLTGLKTFLILIKFATQSKMYLHYNVRKFINFVYGVTITYLSMEAIMNDIEIPDKVYKKDIYIPPLIIMKQHRSYSMYVF